MARVKGTVVSTTYEPSKRQPIDARMLVTKYADLINPEIWIPTGLSSQMCYNGMLTAVNSDGDYNGIYYLTNRAAITADNYAAYQAAVTNDEDVSPFFTMWTKLATLDELDSLAERVSALEATGGGSSSEEGTNGLTEEEVNSLIITQIDDLKAEISAAGYLTSNDLNDYATKEYLTDELAKIVIPEDVSDRVSTLEGKITNVENTISTLIATDATHSEDISKLNSEVTTQSSLITNIQDSISALDDRVAASENLEESVELLDIEVKNINDNLNLKADISTLNDYATKSELSAFESSIGYAATDPEKTFVEVIDETFAKKSELPNVEGFASKAELEEAVNGITIPSNLSELTNDAGFLTAIPEEYITDQELTQKGYLTEHQSLDGYAKTEDIPDVSEFITITDVEAKNYLTSIPEEYITETELNEKGFAEMSAVTALSKTIENKLDMSTYEADKASFLTEIPSDYITEDELSAKGFITEHQDISGLATKAELDAYATDDDVAAKADKATTLSGYGITDAYTRTEIDDKFTEFAGGGSINLDGYVSEDEWNERVALLATNDALGLTQAEVDAVEKNLNDNYSTTEQVKTMVNEHVVTTLAYGEF